MYDCGWLSWGGLKWGGEGGAHLLPGPAMPPEEGQGGSLGRPRGGRTRDVAHQRAQVLRTAVWSNHHVLCGCSTEGSISSSADLTL
jgi:hypothetical protein